MIRLRLYQATDTAAIRSEYKRGHRAVLYVAPTGSGKGVLFTYIASEMARRGKRAWILVHRQELLGQTSRNLTAFGVDHGLVAPQYTMDPRSPLQVASVQTIVRRLDKLAKPDLIILDECFPAGTIVDGMPIDAIRVGQEISAFDHDVRAPAIRRVVDVYRRRYGGAWVRIVTKSGREIVCTEGHPIYTIEHGYVPAMLLTRHGAAITLLAHDDLPKLQKQSAAQTSASHSSFQFLRPEVLPPVATGSERKAKADDVAVLSVRQDSSLQEASIFSSRRSQGHGVLLSQVPLRRDVKKEFRDNDEDEPSGPEYPFCPNEVAQSNAAREDPYEDDSLVQGSNFSRKGRQWDIDQAADHSEGCHWTGDRGCHRDKAGARTVREFTEELQGGFGGCGVASCGRGGWENSSFEEMEILGREKDSGSQRDGLDRIEIYERGSGCRPSWVPESDIVYNLHVEGLNNYFANGILVHNCHHAVSPSWRAVIDACPSSKLLGCSATPERLDGRGLGEVFNTMVVGPTVQELTNQGYLAPATVYAPPQLLDMTGVAKRGGDYAKDEAAKRVDVPTITGDAVQHFSRICPDVPAIAFCASVLHAEHVAAQFRDAGFRSISVDGSLDDVERKKRIDGLANGSVQVLTSCDLISEGLDIGCVTAAIMLRPTQSLSLARQQIGRVLRPAPGKKRAIILDHVGNIPRHGLPTEEIEWTLEGGAAKKRGDAEKALRLRQCPKCYRTHTPSPVCPECGWIYESDGRAPPKQIDGELEELSEIESFRQKAERKKEVQRAKTLADLVAIEKARGYKHGWAYAQWRVRQQYQAKYARKA